jgi:beta-glucosidase
MAKDKGSFKFQDSSMPIAERVDDLVSRLTLEEKISQMVFDAPAIERLGVPAYNWWNECLHGVARAGIATVFPQAIGLAATWDINLMSQISETISNEARAKHHEALRRGVRAIYTGLTFWSPNVNIVRDPRWGRGQETYGECPYLTARMGVTFVKGLQGDDPRYLKVVATPKHYAVHSGPELDRHRFDALASERDMRETYLPAFEACVKEAQAVSVMGAYNRTNGEPCCASPTLLEKVLRQEWGFGGPSGLDAYVVSDCWAIRDIYEFHKVAETAAEASAMAVKAGCDLNCGIAYPALREAVEQGLIDEATIDTAVKRLFTARFRLGMFDPPEQVAYAQIPYQVVDSPAHRALALQAARESIVLLKNDDILPLKKDIKSIAVIGPHADNLLGLLGNYHGIPSQAVTVLEGICKKVSSQTTIYTAQGCPIVEGMPTMTTVPASALRPLDADAGQAGLRATYYDNIKLEGKAALTRVDPLVNFDWKSQTPVTGRQADPFSVRWEGFLIPPVSGTYQLGVQGLNKYWLTLDGQVVARREANHDVAHASSEILLEAGRLYRLRLDFVSYAASGSVQLQWAVPGVDYLTPAVRAATNADVVIMALGLAPNLEAEEKVYIDIPGFKGGDRTEISLPAPQEELLKQIHALGKPIVLVMQSGSALAVKWAAENVPAILQAWYPGQSGGDAIADVIFGDYNPAGRLPITFYQSLDDLPPFKDYKMSGRTYRYFDDEPLYPFGYGLSYTEFEYSDLQLSEKCVRLDGADMSKPALSVSVNVRNTGDLAGDEVVQVYLTDIAASVPVPIRQLVGFERVHLDPGETQEVSFALTPRQLSLIDDSGQRVVEPGGFQVSIGGRQPTHEDFVSKGSGVLIETFEVTGGTVELT